MTLETEAPATLEMNGTEADAQINMQVIQETSQTDKAEVRPQTESGTVEGGRKWLNKTCLKKAGQYGSRNPVSDCVRFVLGDEITLELMPDMNMS